MIQVYPWTCLKCKQTYYPAVPREPLDKVTTNLACIRPGCAGQQYVATLRFDGKDWSISVQPVNGEKKA